MTHENEKRRNTVSAEAIMYSLVFLLSFVGFAYLLARNGQVSLRNLCAPAIVIGLLSLFIRLFAAIVPGFVLVGLVMYGLLNRSTLLFSMEAKLIAFSGLIAIVTSARLSGLNKPFSRLIASRRINNSASGNKASTPIGWGHTLTLPLLLFAWWFAGFLSSHLTLFARNSHAYGKAYGRLHENLGVLPEWYVGLKVLFFLTFVLWICRQIFGYVALKNRDRGVAAMHLRSELWRWDGTEQRWVGRQLGRKRRDS